MNVVEVADVATHCENALGLLHVNVPGVQGRGRAVEEGVGVDVGDEVGEVTAMMESVVGVVSCGDMVGDVLAVGDVVAVVAPDVSITDAVVVVVVRRPSSSNVLVRLPVSVSMDPVAEGGAAGVEELPKGKGGTVVGVEAVVMPEDVPVVVVAEPPLISNPGPGSGVMAS